MMPSRFILLVTVCTFLMACATQYPTQISLSSVNGEPIQGYLHFPNKSAVPYPVVIDLHGCSGIWQQRNQQWIPRLNAQGFAVLQVDSFKPRGTDNVCDDVFRVAPMVRLMDVVGAIGFVTHHPQLDKDKIFLMGMSHGASTALLANMYDSPVFSKLKGIVAYYPYCPAILPILNTDLLILIGASDDWTPANLCQSMHIVNKNNHSFDLKIYQDAYHTFDIKGVDENYFGHRVKYHPHAASDSIRQVRAFLQQRL